MQSGRLLLNDLAIARALTGASELARERESLRTWRAATRRRPWHDRAAAGGQPLRPPLALAP